MAPNPDFVAAVESRFDKAETLLLLCRSGKRSAAATEAVLRAGFRRVFNVREGFEGEADAFGRRGLLDGWRFHGLPWIQD